MNILFFGTADFASPCLQALVNAGHTIVAVVTQPDKPSGRGQQLSASPVKKLAEHLGLPILQPRRVRSDKFVATVTDLRPDLIAVAAFGQIIPQSILDIPRLGPINVHGSLLPRHRGAAPIQRAIMEGDRETGVTTMWMDATLDTGDILLVERTPIFDDEDAGALFVRLSEIGADLLVQTIAGLERGSVVRVPQNDDEATYAAMIQPADSEIRWEETAQVCSNRIRGVSPRPGAFAWFAGKRLKIWKAHPNEEPTSYRPGTIIRLNKSDTVDVAAGGTVLSLIEVQPDSGKRMKALDWARGTRLEPGMCFKVD